MLTFFYYFIIYLLFETFTTIYHLPFTAMIVDLSQSLHFRDSATVSRMFFEVFGVLLGESFAYFSLQTFRYLDFFHLLNHLYFVFCRPCSYLNILLRYKKCPRL